MQTVEPLLGTRAEVHAEAPSSIQAEAAENAVLQEVARLEQIFTVFDDTSALQEFRRTGATASAELAQVVELAGQWHDRSDGAFNPATQALMELWDRAEAANSAPSSQDLAAAVAAPASDRYRLDNLNAIAKGWIAQAGVNAVRDQVDSVWLSLGGDIVHIGSGSLTVGVEDPHRPYDNVAPMATIEVSAEAVATSGGTRRWWTIDGRRFAKVLDPRTGSPVDRLASATVIAPDAATADVLATIALVADESKTLALAADAGADCLLVYADKTRTCTSERFVFA